MNAPVVPVTSSLRRRLALWSGVVFLAVGVVAVAVAALAARSSMSVPVGSLPGQGPVVPAPGTVADVRPLVVGSLVAVAALLVAGPLLGWLVAGRLLRPVRTLTEAAQQISATDLHRRLEVGAADHELARLARTLNDLFARLDAAFGAQRRFVANAAHELRTPLAAERTLLQVVLADPEADVEQLREAVQEALALGRRQEHLLDALLTLARGERGTDVTEPVDLAELAGGAVAERAAAAAARGLLVSTELTPAGVVGDRVLLESLVGNLVENAVRHAIPGGSVWVRTGTGTTVPGLAETDPTRTRGAVAEDRCALLFVENDGPVIPPQEVGRLLEPFQRLGRDRVPHSAGGSGLGLAVARAVVNAHAGTLTARARTEGGLAVTVTLPLPADRAVA